MIYLFIILLLLVLAIQYDIIGKTRYKDNWYNVMLVVFILLAGLRWRLSFDTPNYLHSFYYVYPELDDFSIDDYPVGRDPLWILINAFVKSLGGRYYIVQLIEASFVNVLVFKYFKKHSSFIFMCLFFYFITCYAGYCMEIMRAAFSIVICLYANDLILEKKYLKGYLLLFISLFFHAQTLVMFVIPVFFYLRLNKKGIIILCFAFVLGAIIQKSLGDYIKLIELGEEINNKATNYVDSEKFGDQTGNINFFIVNIFPNLFYSLLSLFYLKKIIPSHKVLSLEPLLMVGVLFLILQTNLQIAYRFVDYFRIIFVLFYAEFFVLLVKNVSRIDRHLAISRALLFFFPFFLLVGYARSFTFISIYPYSSVIELKINNAREARYLESGLPSANENEY